MISILMLHTITSRPTNIMDVLRGSRPTNLAAIGAAIRPPIIRPTMVCQCVAPSKIKKVKALDKVTKNSVILTEPIT